MKQSIMQISQITLVLMISMGLSNYLVEAQAQDERPSAPKRPREVRPERTERTERPATRRDASAVQIDVERREEVRAFMRENLPELERMLEVMSKRRPALFDRALASADESYTRLQAIKKTGNEALYRNALENWKIDAHIKMISAQLSVRDNPELEKRLNRLVNRQIDNRLAHLRDEKARLIKQLERVDGNLAKFETDREAELERRVNAILKSSEKARSQFQALQGSADRSGKSSKENPERPKSRPNRERDKPKEIPDGEK